MGDLKNPRWMWLKAWLFLGIGTLSVGLVLLRTRDWQVAVFLALAIWAFCRAYYFTFYVIQHYIDPQFRFAGLLDFLRYHFRERGKK